MLFLSACAYHAARMYTHHTSGVINAAAHLCSGTASLVRNCCFLVSHRQRMPSTLPAIVGHQIGIVDMDMDMGRLAGMWKKRVGL